MDAAARYRHLRTLGRDGFLAAAAPAVLIRRRGPGDDAAQTATSTLTFAVDPVVDALPARGTVAADLIDMELFPLIKKPGASFRDRITIGRTANNDVVIADPSVSRLHAYVRDADAWRIADAGSKNGSWLDGARLDPRREAALASGATLRIGDVQLTFYRADKLFEVLGGNDGGQ